MAKRFGRNQRRKLRDELEKTKAKLHRAELRAMMGLEPAQIGDAILESLGMIKSHRIEHDYERNNIDHRVTVSMELSPELSHQIHEGKPVSFEGRRYQISEVRVYDPYEAYYGGPPMISLTLLPTMMRPYGYS